MWHREAEKDLNADQQSVFACGQRGDVFIHPLWGVKKTGATSRDFRSESKLMYRKIAHPLNEDIN